MSERGRWNVDPWNRALWWPGGAVHGHLIVGTQLADFTAEASAELPGYPAGNLRSVAHPRRGWRATAGADLAVVCTLTTPVRVTGVVIPWTNAAHVAIDLSTDGTTWAPVDPMPLPTYVDPRTERRKLCWWAPDPAAPFSAAVRLRTFGTPLPGDTLEVGAVAVVAARFELTQNVGFPITWTIIRPATRVDFTDGSVEWNAEGPPRLRYQFQSPVWRGDRPTMPELLTIVHGAKGRPIVIDENRGNPAAVYVGTIAEDFTAAERFAVFDAGLVFEEFG